MRLKISIATILMTLLFSGSAFAASLEVFNGFEDWTNVYTDGQSNGLGFSSGGWAFKDISSLNLGYDATGVAGSVSTSSSSVGVRFTDPATGADRPATRFLFHYSLPGAAAYLSIDLSAVPTSVGVVDPDNPANYFHAGGDSGATSLPDGFRFIQSSGDKLVFELTGVTVPNSFNSALPGTAASFDFYMINGFDSLLTIEALSFTAFNPLDAASGPTGEVITLTALDYTPTPIPGAVWLLGSGLVGLVGLRRRFQA